jgi:gamma-F420-2:alpha-L-glutamate ligase
MREAAAQRGIDLTAIEIFDISFITDGERASTLYRGADPARAYDALVARTFFPHISEALTVARLFREAGRCVIDESLTDEGFVMSKMHDYVIMAQHGIPVPRTWQVYDPSGVEALAETLGYPCVLKGAHGSHGTHVHLAENAEQLRRRLWSYQTGELLLQEFLPAEEDYRLLVIGYKALPALVSRKPAPGEFRTNVGFSRDAAVDHSAQLGEMIDLAERSARALRREFAGVDIRFRDGRPVVLEVNRRPVFENFERVTGLDVAGRFVEYARDKVKGLT